VTEKPPVEIVIPNYNGHEAIALCLEAIRRRTAYPTYGITVLNNPGDGQDAPYLRLLRDARAIRLIETDHDRKPGEAMYDLLHASPSNWVCHMESDVEVLTPDWLDILMRPIQNPECDIAVARWIMAWDDDKAVTPPVWGPEVMLLNLRLYRPFLEPDDFQQRSIPLADYKYRARLPVILPPNYSGYVNLDTCWRFTEKVTYENSARFRVAHIPAGYFGFKVRHYDGISTRPTRPEIQPRWAMIRTNLAALRRS